MKAEYINPFIESALNVIRTMSGVEVDSGKPMLKKGNLSFGDISGVIGLAGEGVSGSLVVSFEKDCILNIVNLMLSTDYTELTDDIVDAVGEITNMICGNTKRELDKVGVKIQMATPMIIRGRNVEISQISQAPVISIPFQAPGGMFQLEANLSNEGGKSAERIAPGS